MNHCIAVTLGIGLAAQQPVLFFVTLMLGWIVLPVVLGSDS